MLLSILRAILLTIILLALMVYGPNLLNRWLDSTDSPGIVVLPEDGPTVTPRPLTEAVIFSPTLAPSRAPIIEPTYTPDPDRLTEAELLELAKLPNVIILPTVTPSP